MGPMGLYGGMACEPSMSPFHPLLPRMNSRRRFVGLLVWVLYIGWAWHPGPGLDIKIINVGGWLANCDEMLETKVDFLVVTEHRLVPARAGSDGKRSRAMNISSLWTAACQESSHVGHAGEGIVSLKEAPLVHAVPCTHDFKSVVGLWRFHRCAHCSRGCCVRVPKGLIQILKKPSVTDLLFQAVLCELSVVGQGHPQLISTLQDSLFG